MGVIVDCFEHDGTITAAERGECYTAFFRCDNCGASYEIFIKKKNLRPLFVQCRNCLCHTAEPAKKGGQ